MLHVCISHAPLRFSPAVPFEFVSPVPLDGLDITLIDDGALGPRYNGRVLSEYLQLFVLAERWRNLDEMIHLFQYRRFLTPIRPANTETRITGGAKVDRHTVPNYVPSFARLEAVTLLTIGTILKRPMAEQFAAHHNISDLMNLALSMVQSGQLSEEDARQFLVSKIMLPSPSIGIYPAAMLVEHLDIMRGVWEHFVDHYYQPRTGYQRRIGGFLMERLQGYLVLRHIDRHRDEPFNVWYRIMLERAPLLE